MIMGGESPTEIPEIDERHLLPSLDGVRFPAPKWQLLAYAEYNGAGLPIRLALWRLPERLYRNVSDIAHAIKATYQEPSPGSLSETCAESARPAVRSPRAVPVVPLAARRKRPR
ncbi:MAG TPA: DUF2795 domain-containing protein [Pseudonocardia sp.]|jgi:hypothetical protein